MVGRQQRRKVRKQVKSDKSYDDFSKSQKSPKNILLFARYLDTKNVPILIRHVIVEGYTTNEEALVRLGEFIGTLKNLKSLDCLPYHTMGKNKYRELGIEYPLENMKALDKSVAIKAKEFIIQGIKNVRKGTVNKKTEHKQSV